MAANVFSTQPGFSRGSERIELAWLLSPSRVAMEASFDPSTIERGEVDGLRLVLSKYPITPLPSTSMPRDPDRFSATVSIPERYRELWESFIDPSDFIELCLKDATGIMAWGIAREKSPTVIRQPLPKSWKKVIKDYNGRNPDRPRKPKLYIEMGED